MKEGEFATMQGTLLKWTNYFSGWQPRWFLLENGILSYFQSEDDINDGCKGSIKMSVCDVTVHPTDNTRLDLIIPGEAHFYVKASTSQERQQWLVALGSSKACLTNGEAATQKEEIPGEELKSKRSELRLYCDLLMQQVHSVKSSVDESSAPDIEKLNEASGLLSATCDMFINTLDECMSLLQNTSAGKSDAIPISPSRKHSSSSSKSVPWGPSPNVSRSTSLERYAPNIKSASSHRNKQPSRSRTSSESTENVTAPISPVKITESVTSSEEHVTLSSQDKLNTFFTNMSFQLIKVDSDGCIPTLQFLNACQEIIPFLEKLNQPAFKPVKIDIVGNIRKVEQKQNSRPELFTTLQSMILFEIQARQSHLSSSATVAILWLKRTFEFTRELIYEYLNDSSDVTSAVNAAYVKTLKSYHGWVVRGVFGVAVQSVPSPEQLLQCIAVDEDDADKPEFLLAMETDLQAYANSIDNVIRPLQEFYTKHGLDSPDQV